MDSADSTTILNKTNILSLSLILISGIVYIILTSDDSNTKYSKKEETTSGVGMRKVWFYGKQRDVGHLEEIVTVLNRLGYANSSNNEDWDLLWAHDYPFRKLYTNLRNLKPHQKVNHFPGCGYITNKVHLATTLTKSNKFIPKAFRLPEDKNELITYSTINSEAIFVEKNNDHRRIKIKDIKDIDLESNSTFIQVYIDKPLLVDGYKFDIGIYTVITSIDPLRVYIYNGEALLRFCPTKYFPFDPEDIDKYVIGDDYLPIWDVPALDYYYNKLGLGMRDSLNAYLDSVGKNYSRIWSQIEEAIRLVMLEKEEYILNITSNFKSKYNFFEIMRFDFIVHENLTVYLLEANMSPNLSSQHFPQNKALYQQVLYSTLGLVGIGEKIYKNSFAPRNKEEQDMIASDKHIGVYPRECNSDLCRTSCEHIVCQLCNPCLLPETKKFLLQAVFEHFQKADCKRIFPPKMNQHTVINPEERKLTSNNYLQYMWFQGKCILDDVWC